MRITEVIRRKGETLARRTTELRVRHLPVVVDGKLKAIVSIARTGWTTQERDRLSPTCSTRDGPGGAASRGERPKVKACHVTDWTLTYDGFDPAEEGLRETLTSTGNGYFCTRGAAEWEDAGGVHYPGTYAHGGYNRETTIMGGHPVLNEDLVNLPNWLVLKLRIEGEEPIRLDDVELLSYRHEYDVRNALVIPRAALPRSSGPRDQPAQPRFVSMARMHQAAIDWTLTPENWSGRVEVVSAIDGRVLNRGVARYRQLEGRHLDPRSPAVVRPRRHRAEGANPPLADRGRAGGAHPRLPRRRGARGRSPHRPDGGLRPPGPDVRCA